MTSPQAQQAMANARRTNPVVKLGDRFGDRIVTRTMPRGHRGRSDERVVWRCVCGREGESYVFNLRKVKPFCTHATERPTVQSDDVCTCDHAKGDHRPRGGSCLEDDCDCTEFDARYPKKKAGRPPGMTLQMIREAAMVQARVMLKHPKYGPITIALTELLPLIAKASEQEK